MRQPADCSISAEMNYTRAEQSILQSARPVLDKDGRPAAHQAALLQSRAGILSAPALTLTLPPRPQLDHKLELSTRPQRTHKTQNLVYFLYSRLNPACLEFLFSEMNCSERIPCGCLTPGRHLLTFPALGIVTPPPVSQHTSYQSNL